MNAFHHLKGLVAPLVFLSFIGNIAILVSPIFMMQVLDRVVPSGNMRTLFLLLAVAIGFLTLNAFVDLQKSLVQNRTAQWIEKTGADLALKYTDQIRQGVIENTGLLKSFVVGPNLTHAINIPWVPLFLLALALIHPLFLILVATIVGLNCLIGAVVSSLSKDSATSAVNLSNQEIKTLQNALDTDILAGNLATSENLIQRYVSLQEQRHALERRTHASVGFQGASGNMIRTSAQLLSLSLGASLVVKGQLSAGGMIGASIIAAKTIQTIEGSLSNFPKIYQGYCAFKALRSTSDSVATTNTEVADLSGELRCHDLIFPRGNGAPARLDRISFELAQGECLAIIGDSGSGKTTLLKALSGQDRSPIGAVFFDDTEIGTMGPKTYKSAIGYLTQQATLLQGTVAENISCFQPNCDDELITRAAKLTGIHGLISALPEAYQTDIAHHPHLLTAGQKQRVAFARTLFHDPQYIFLDEPNALLDADGERQLCDTIASLKAQGKTIVMVLHRSGIMGLADKVMALDQGRMIDFGARAEVLGRMSNGKQRLKLPLNANSLQDLNDWVSAQFSRHTDAEFLQKSILVATEMFNTALQNGPSDVKRDCTFTFKFVDQDHCEIILSEERPTEATQKIQKVKSLLNHPEVNMVDLPMDEISLAVLAQLTSKLSVENHDKSSFFSAHVISDKFQKQDKQVH